MNNIEKILIGTGIVLTSSIAMTNEADAAMLPNYYVTNKGIEVMYRPSVHSDVKFNIGKDELVDVKYYSKTGKWCMIKYKGYSGWAQTKYLTVYEDDLISEVKTKCYLNLRNKPTTYGSSVIKTLKPNTGLIILKKYKNWIYVKPLDGQGQRGWVSANYVY